MNDIVKVVVKTEPSWGCIDEMDTEKITIRAHSITYVRRPQRPENAEPIKKWSYKTTSSEYSKLYEKLKQILPGMLDEYLKLEGNDDGDITKFTLTYADNTKRNEIFILCLHQFTPFFNILKKMIPPCELGNRAYL